jgi:hypothetical protein
MVLELEKVILGSNVLIFPIPFLFLETHFQCTISTHGACIPLEG